MDSNANSSIRKWSRFSTMLNRFILFCFLCLSSSVWSLNTWANDNVYRQLSVPDQIYLDSFSVVTLCVDPKWPPFDYLTPEGKHEGVFADFLDRIARQLHIHFKVIATDSWKDSISTFRSGDCQLISGLNKTPERSEFMLFTEPFLSAPMVIISRQKEPYVTSLQSLNGKSLASVKGYRIADEIAKKYPEVELHYFASTPEALTAVANSKVYATVGSILGVNYNVDALGLKNLKVIGHSEFTGEYRIAIHPSLKPLRPLLNQAISALSEQDKNQIINQWIKLMDYKKPDYSLLWQVLFWLGLISSFVLYRHVNTLKHNKHLANANKKLRVANEENETLIKMVSHQYRTPLAIIKSGLKLLSVEVKNYNPTTLQRLEAMNRAIKRMSDTLDISLNEQRNGSKQCESGGEVALCYLNEAIEQSLSTLNDQATGHQFIWERTEDFNLMIPEKEFVCCLDNLLGNAVKYSKPGDGPISIICKIRQDYIDVSVSDSGKGIVPAEKNKIFEKFYRGQNAGDVAGAGLGLTITAQLISQFGGTLDVENNTHKGCKFTLSLPL